jgi:hypothetical protein
VARNSKFKFWHVPKIEFYLIKNLLVRIHLKSAKNYRIKFSAQCACAQSKFIYIPDFLLILKFLCTPSTLKTVLRMNWREKIKLRGPLRKNVDLINEVLTNAAKYHFRQCTIFTVMKNWRADTKSCLIRI